MELGITPNSVINALFNLQYDRKITEMVGNMWERLKIILEKTGIALCCCLFCNVDHRLPQSKEGYSGIESCNGIRSNYQRNNH